MTRPTPDDIGRWLGGDATDARNVLITWAAVMTLVVMGVIW